jgi:hypothetical protein
MRVAVKSDVNDPGPGKRLSVPEPEYFTAESAEFPESGVFLKRTVFYSVGRLGAGEEACEKHAGTAIGEIGRKRRRFACTLIIESCSRQARQGRKVSHPAPDKLKFLLGDPFDAAQDVLCWPFDAAQDMLCARYPHSSYRLRLCRATSSAPRR